VAPIRDPFPKAGPSTYKCGHKQQFLIFFLKLLVKERNLQNFRTGIRDGLLLERLFAKIHDAKSFEKQRIAAFSL